MARIVDPMCDSRVLVKNTGLVDHSTCILRMLDDPTICMSSKYTSWEVSDTCYY